MLSYRKNPTQTLPQADDNDKDQLKEDDDEMNLGATGGTLIKKEENQ